MPNPSISDLQNSDDYKLIAQLEHHEIRNFVLEQLTGNAKPVKRYMRYQLLMVMLGLFFLVRAVVLAYQGFPQAMYWSLASLVFSFSVLIVIHELVHGIALKASGAKKVHYGGYLSKFVFFAEADRHVLNRRQFTRVALAPLVLVKIISLAGILVFIHHAAVFFFVILMSTHSLFCAGDIGLLSLFSKYKNTEVYTFDLRAEKKSFYYRKTN